MMQQPLINLENITVAYDKHIAVDNVSFQVEKGDFIGLIGENGSGKTTLIKTLLGTVKHKEGTIFIKKGLKIGYLPQHLLRQDNVFPATAEEVVLMGLLSQKKFPRFYSKKDYQKVKTLFQSLHIEAILKKRVGLLSGGQQQRVMLARALINDPDVLILDEPTSALDSVIERSFLETLKRLNKKEGTSIIMITHDLASMGSYINKVIYLDKTIIFKGAFDRFCNDQTLSPYLMHHASHACHNKEAITDGDY